LITKQKICAMTLPPPIRICPRFVPDADVLFRQFLDGTVWDERMRARKTASFGVAYNYSQISYPAAPMPDALQQVCQALKLELGFMPNNCLMNFYPDGSASMGFHSDSSAELAPTTGIAIVSLGAERDLVFRSKHDRSSEFVFPLENGSLLYMSQEMQQDWLHAVPKAEGAGARISLTFRAICPSDYDQGTTA
jgi:alkylated DNA repair dioxygenase AlkB